MFNCNELKSNNWSFSCLFSPLYMENLLVLKSLHKLGYYKLIFTDKISRRSKLVRVKFIVLGYNALQINTMLFLYTYVSESILLSENVLSPTQSVKAF